MAGTALVAADFDITVVPLDVRKNIVMGFGTITLNDDYLADTWVISPALLGVKEIKAIALDQAGVAMNELATPTGPWPLFLDPDGSGGYYLQADQDFAGTTQGDVDALDGKVLKVMFVGTGLHAAA